MANTTSVNGRFVKKYNISKEWLIENLNKGIGPYKMAKQIGCNAHIIYNRLKEYGLESTIAQDKEIKAHEKFHFLTTLERVGKTKQGNPIWKCVCDCGNFCEVSTSALRNGETKGCGCRNKLIGKDNPLWKGYSNISGNYVSNLRNGAKRRKLEFTITAEFIWKLLIKQNFKCAISKLDINIYNGASLDRIDSTKGYTEDNVHWLHQAVNTMKWDFSTENFLKMCKIIVDNNQNAIEKLDNIPPDYSEEFKKRYRNHNKKHTLLKKDINGQMDSTSPT